MNSFMFEEESDKIPVNECFISAICKAKDVAIEEINMITGCMNDEDEKDDDHDRKICNLKRAMEVLHFYVHIKHEVEDTAVIAEVEKRVMRHMERKLHTMHEHMEAKSHHVASSMHHHPETVIS